MRTDWPAEQTASGGRLRLARHLSVVEDVGASTFILDERRTWRVRHRLARAVLAEFLDAPTGLTLEELGTRVAHVPGDVRVAVGELWAIGAVVEVGAVTHDHHPHSGPDDVSGDPADRTTRVPPPPGSGPDQHGGPGATGVGAAEGERGQHLAPATGRVLLDDVGCGPQPVHGIAHALREQGFTVAMSGPEGDDPDTGVGSSPPAWRVLVTRDLLTEDLDDRIAAALSTGSRVLVARVSAGSAAVGPVYRPTAPPGRTAPAPCPSCVRHQLQRNVEPTAAYARRLVRAEARTSVDRTSSTEPAGRPPHAVLGEVSPSAVLAAADLLGHVLAHDASDQPLRRDDVGSGAGSVVHRVPRRRHPVDETAGGAEEQPPPAAEILVRDAATSTITRHPVTRRPQCPDCGDPGLVAARFCTPPVPAHRAVLPGPAYRAATAADVLARTRHLFDPLTGLLGDVADLGSVAGTHVTRGRHPVAPQGSGWRRALALGRGAGPDDARAALLGEAVERYCCAWHGDEPVVLASRSGIGDRAVTPAQLSLFSPAQQAAGGGRGGGPAAPTGLDLAPPALPDDVLLDWAPVTTFPGGEVRFVPASSVFFGHRDPGGVEHAVPDSNGCAAGATLEDAMLSALLELVERDAVGIWWYSMAHRPPVTDPAALAALAPAARALSGIGRDIHLLDLTTDLGIPVVAAVSARGGREIVFGFGAHLDVARAARRALGEVSQMLAVGPEAAHPEHRLRHGAAERFWATARLDDLPYLVPDPVAPSAPGQVSPTGDLLSDVLAVTARLDAAGLEVLALDVTRPDIDLPVVRVIVPGLRHFWPRFAPGRLYDVPVALGWRKNALTEEACNSLPLFV